MKPTKNKNLVFDINFFDIKFSKQMRYAYPLLIGEFLSCLYRSTLPIQEKISLIETLSQSKASFLRAITVLEKHYFTRFFTRRNQELQAYQQNNKANKFIHNY